MIATVATIAAVGRAASSSGILAVDKDCQVTNAIMPALDFFAGNALGLGETGAKYIVVILIVAIIFAAKSKALPGLVKAVGIVVAGVLMLTIIASNPEIIPGEGC